MTKFCCYGILVLLNFSWRWLVILRDVRVNTRIRASQVRVISDDGQQLGIFTLQEAVAKAREKGLDLIEVAPDAKPPVCRIANYGKFIYEMHKKERQAKKKQKIISVKEIKIRPKIDEHDYQTKLRHLQRFLSRGDKAKVTIMFRGREMAHQDLGKKILDRVVENLAEISEVEMQAKMEGYNMILVLSPKKKK